MPSFNLSSAIIKPLFSHRQCLHNTNIIHYHINTPAIFLFYLFHLIPIAEEKQKHFLQHKRTWCDRLLFKFSDMTDEPTVSQVIDQPDTGTTETDNGDISQPMPTLYYRGNSRDD